MTGVIMDDHGGPTVSMNRGTTSEGGQADGLHVDSRLTPRVHRKHRTIVARAGRETNFGSDLDMLQSQEIVRTL